MQTSVTCADFCRMRTFFITLIERASLARMPLAASLLARGPAEAVQVPAHCGAPSPLQSTPTDCACRRLAGLLRLDLSRGLHRLAQACFTAPPFHSSSCVERSGAQKAGTPTCFPLASYTSRRDFSSDALHMGHFAVAHLRDVRNRNPFLCLPACLLACSAASLLICMGHGPAWQVHFGLCVLGMLYLDNHLSIDVFSCRARLQPQLRRLHVSC